MAEKLTHHWTEISEIVSGLTNTGIWELITTGELPSFKIGRRRLVSHEAVVEFVKKRERAAKPGRYGDADANSCVAGPIQAVRGPIPPKRNTRKKEQPRVRRRTTPAPKRSDGVDGAN